MSLISSEGNSRMESIRFHCTTWVTMLLEIEGELFIIIIIIYLKKAINCLKETFLHLTIQLSQNNGFNRFKLRSTSSKLYSKKM